MKNKIKKILEFILDPIGLKLVNKEHLLSKPIGIVDLRESGLRLSPIDIKKFKSKNHIYFLLNIDSEKMRSNRLIDSWVNTLKLYENDKNQLINKRESYIYLKEFYNSFQPKNVLEYFELSSDQNIMTKEMSDYFSKNPYYAVLPWEDVNPEQMFNGNRTAIRNEFEKNSEHKYQDSDGCKMFGPISDRMLLVEYERLVKVYNSIKEKGYKDENNAHDEMDNFPRATIFLNKKNEYKIKSECAWHRTAALLALNYKKIPFRVSNQNVDIFYEKEVENWPNVKNGLFTKNQAIILFNKNI